MKNYEREPDHEDTMEQYDQMISAMKAKLVAAKEKRPRQLKDLEERKEKKDFNDFLRSIPEKSTREIIEDYCMQQLSLLGEDNVDWYIEEESCCNTVVQEENDAAIAMPLLDGTADCAMDVSPVESKDVADGAASGPVQLVDEQLDREAHMEEPVGIVLIKPEVNTKGPATRTSSSVAGGHGMSPVRVVRADLIGGYCRTQIQWRTLRSKVQGVPVPQSSTWRRWPKGVYPGDGGHIRTVRVRLRGIELIRPEAMVFLLKERGRYKYNRPRKKTPKNPRKKQEADTSTTVLARN